jgi:WD40 repeat protein
VLTGGYDKTAQLWDAHSGKPIGPPLRHQGPVIAVAFSPDGHSALTGSEDQTAQLWDSQSGKPIGPPLQHQRGLGAVAFSPDGQSVLTMTAEGRVHLARFADGQLRHTSTRWCYGALPFTDIPLFLEKNGNHVAIADFVTGTYYAIRNIRFDIAEAEPFNGDPSRLSADFLDRAALQFARDGVTLIPRWPLAVSSKQEPNQRIQPTYTPLPSRPPSSP